MSCHDSNKHTSHNHHASMVRDYRRRFFISLILSLPVLIFTPLIQEFIGISITFPGQAYITLAIATIIYLYGGWPFLSGLVAELRKKAPGMMTLVALAISVAFLYSIATTFGLEGKTLLWELVTLIDIMLLGHWIEMKSIMGASNALEKLAALLPKVAHRVSENGTIEDVPLEEVSIGDRLQIKPGEKVPIDGKVISGTTAMDESMLTGETKLQEKSEGDTVVGGAINSDGTVTIVVEKTGDDTYLAQMQQLVADAQAQKSKLQHVANRAAQWLTFIALGAGALTLAGWIIFTGAPLSYALERTIAVMVITCPHALGLAVPLVISFSTTLASQRGLLISNRTAFEQARNISAVLFDKTGTLTEGKFSVSDIVPTHTDADTLINIAGSIESYSEHAIAQTIAAQETEKATVENFKAIPGAGVYGEIEGKSYMVMSPKYLNEHGIDIPPAAEELLESGKTTVFILEDKEVLGAIALDDVIRREAKEAVERLRASGIEPAMITGDAQAVADRVAGELGITTYFAEVSPEEKEAKVRYLQEKGHVVAMVGDGVNDAPALARADVGVAIGAGTDVTIAAADIILVRDDPRDVVHLIALGRATYRKIIQNLWWASGYNIVAIPLAAGVLLGVGIVLSPAVGAVLMSLSTVIVAANAIRLKYGYGKK